MYPKPVFPGWMEPTIKKTHINVQMFYCNLGTTLAILLCAEVMIWFVGKLHRISLKNDHPSIVLLVPNNEEVAKHLSLSLCYGIIGFRYVLDFSLKRVPTAEESILQ